MQALLRRNAFWLVPALLAPLLACALVSGSMGADPRPGYTRPTSLLFPQVRGAAAPVLRPTPVIVQNAVAPPAPTPIVREYDCTVAADTDRKLQPANALVEVPGRHLIRSEVTPISSPSERRRHTHGSKIALAIVLDDSGSMKDNDGGKVRYEAVSKLLDKLGSEDKAKIVRFWQGQVQPSSWESHGFTRQMLGVMEATIPDGGTPLLEAVKDAADSFGELPDEYTRIVIALTDGFPTNDVEGMEQSVRDSGATLNVVQLVTEKGAQKAKSDNRQYFNRGLSLFDKLTQAATDSGGKVVKATDANELLVAMLKAGEGVVRRTSKKYRVTAVFRSDAPCVAGEKRTITVDGQSLEGVVK